MAFWNVKERSIPPNSQLLSNCHAVSYQDSYEIALSDPHQSAADLTRALALSAPRWINIAMKVRDRVGACAGLRPVGAIGRSQQVRHAPLIAGQRFDAFMVWHVDESEVVVGEDDKHLDFRLSIMKIQGADANRVALSMVVTTHNLKGKIYLAMVLAGHKVVMRQFLSRASALGLL